jgi:hypothetical protein
MAKVASKKSKVKSQKAAAPSRARKQSANPSAKKSPNLVWRIFHFGQRYELPDDMKICRKSGLQYTKRFVGSGGGDEAVGYQNQFGLLENGDGVESCLLEGVYGRLVNLAAQHSRAKRGYLLDAADEPLGDAQIAKLLNIKTPAMRRMLRRFASVRLLEKVDLPDFDMSINEPPGKGGDGGADSRAGSKSPARGRSGGPKGRARNSSENSGKAVAPLKNGKKGKLISPNGDKGQKKQRATNGLSAVVAKKNNNGNRGQRKAGAQEAQATDLRQDRAQGQEGPPMAAKGSHPPATAPVPLVPRESDAGGSRVISFARRPPGSAQSRAGLQYGLNVYLALKFKWDTDSPQAKREIGSFASMHDKACSVSGAEPPAIDELLRRGLAEAAKIAKRGAKSHKRGAVWCKVMNDIMAKRLTG